MRIAALSLCLTLCACATPRTGPRVELAANGARRTAWGSTLTLTGLLTMVGGGASAAASAAGGGVGGGDGVDPLLAAGGVAVAAGIALWIAGYRLEDSGGKMIRAAHSGPGGEEEVEVFPGLQPEP